MTRACRRHCQTSSPGMSELIMTPFITDANRDHMATSMALSHIDAALLQQRQICLYQLHSHIPDGLLNRISANGPGAGRKGAGAGAYIGQNMTQRLTAVEVSAVQQMAPQMANPADRGAEHFVMLSARQFWSWPPFGTRSSSCDS